MKQAQISISLDRIILMFLENIIFWIPTLMIVAALVVGVH